MQKLNAKEMLAQADQTGQIHRMKSGWRKAQIVCGVCLCLLILTIPLGIWIFHIARNARLGTTDEGFALKWFGTKAWAWSDIEAVKRGNIQFSSGGTGLVGALAAAAVSHAVAKRTQGLNGPLSFKVKGKRLWVHIPAHALERSVEFAEELERRTGLEVLPRPAQETQAQAA